MKNGAIFPIEVKSAHAGRMRSMHLFLESHPNSTFGVKISTHAFSRHGKIIEIPLYGLESWLHA